MSPKTVEEKLNYRFRDPALLSAALTHTSHHRATRHAHDFERLEFLGDAVLGMLVSHLLFELYPHEREGELARRKAALVSRASLVQVAESWGIPAALKLSGAEEARGGRRQATTIEDACEAVIGALFIDGGLEALKPIVEGCWRPMAAAFTAPPKDARTALQEWAQARGLPLPEYELVAQSGSDHKPVFTVRVSLPGQPSAQGEGPSKKQASAAAAEQLMEQLHD